eukprot:344617_1
MVLAQRHGGSNWFMSELLKYKQIYTDGEKLLDWQYDHCSTFAKYYEGIHDCDDPQTFIDGMDAIHMRFLNRTYGCNPKAQASSPDKHFYFWKIQIDQIPPALFKTFVDYVYCSNITLIQLIRTATIASFWSYQAEAMERTQSLNPKLMVHKNKNDLANATRVTEIKLDPYLA